MNRTLIATLAGLALCSFAAGRFDEFVATGVWVGFTAGAGVGLANAFWQRRQVRAKPERVLAVMVLGFLIKLAGALGGALALRFIEPLPQLADWRGFLVAYATAGCLTLLAGSLDNASVLLKRESAL